jgi:hypothetical protein
MNNFLFKESTSELLEEQDLELTALDEGNYLIEEAMREAGIGADEILTEGKNIVKLNKAAKLSLFQARAAMIIAKEKNDPLYTKAMKYRQLFLQYREDIRNKYKGKAIARARIAMRTNRLTEMPKKSNLEPLPEKRI